METLKSINILQTGDVHFGHKRTPTHNIIQSLNQMMYVDNNLRDVDAVIINGDLFDSLLPMPHPDALAARQWMRNFVYQCEINNTIVISLEGTPDHDWKQGLEFTAFETTCDIRHATELSIERIEKLGLTILYVPDECRATPELVWQDVCALLAKNNLDKVDIALVHSGFDFQYPPGLGIKSHDSSLYSGIVKYGVFANHVHTAAQLKKVYGPGSLTRLAHNEEEPKGYHKININHETEKMIVQWIENKHAWTYKAYDVSGLSMEQIIELGRLKAIGLQDGAYVRFDFGDPVVVRSAIAQLGIELPYVIWEMKKEKRSKREEDDIAFTKERFNSPSLTRENSVGVITDWINRKRQVSDDTMNNVVSVLNNAIKEVG